MDSFWFNFVLAQVSILMHYLMAKHDQKGAFHKVALEAFAAIWRVFGDDPEFQAVVGVETPVPPVVLP